MSEPKRVVLEMDASGYDKARARLDARTIDQIADILDDVERELVFVLDKSDKFNSAHEGYAVILEGLDTLWDDVKRNEWHASKYEALQVATMAIRYILEVQP